MDQADEVERRACSGGDLEADRVALSAGADQARVARTVDVRRRVLADAVLQEVESRRGLGVRVGAVRSGERVARLAVEERSGRLGDVLLREDRERVRTLAA